jgi:hypothetical protein
VATRPGITSTILGASKLKQLDDNLGAIEFSIPAELRNQLDQVSAPASIHPYVFFEPFLQNLIHGARVRPWSQGNDGVQHSADSSREPETVEVQG